MYIVDFIKKIKDIRKIEDLFEKNILSKTKKIKILRKNQDDIFTIDDVIEDEPGIIVNLPYKENLYEIHSDPDIVLYNGILKEISIYSEKIDDVQKLILFATMTDRIQKRGMNVPLKSIDLQKNDIIVQILNLYGVIETRKELEDYKFLLE